MCIRDSLIARLLVIAGHLYTQVTAAGVDHDVEISLVVLVHLDEVVPTAQRTDAFFCPEEIHMAGTAQFAQVDLIEVAVGLIPDGEAGGCLLYTSPVSPGWTGGRAAEAALPDVCWSDGIISVPVPRISWQK